MLLLVLLGLAAVLGLENPWIAQDSQEVQQANSPESTQGQGAGGGEETSPGGTSGNSSEEAAAEAVQEFYRLAAARDYGSFTDLLTVDSRQRYFPSQGAFEGTFGTLQSIRFEEGPTAEVSEGTATVTGETIAEHTDRTERNRGTWTLVNENGQWLISGWSVNNISTE